MSRPDAYIGQQDDTPSTIYRTLPARTALAVTAGVVAVTAVAWFFTVHDARSMAGMVDGLGQVGRAMPSDMGPLTFLGMWAVMMTAMMAPAAAPAVLAHHVVAARRGENVASNAAFLAGFLAAWTLVGLAYFLPYLWFRGLTADAAGTWWLPVLAGGALVVAGAYQFTPWKARCQQSCCAPVTAILHQDAGPGLAGAFRTGGRHGVHCLGCCWGLMVVLLAVGLMNLVWMAGLTLLFIAEKHWPRALLVGRVVGVGLVAVGLAVMVWPQLLPAISGAGG